MPFHQLQEENKVFAEGDSKVAERWWMAKGLDWQDRGFGKRWLGGLVEVDALLEIIEDSIVIGDQW